MKMNKEKIKITISTAAAPANIFFDLLVFSLLFRADILFEIFILHKYFFIFIVSVGYAIKMTLAGLMFSRHYPDGKVPSAIKKISIVITLLICFVFLICCLFVTENKYVQLYLYS